MAYKKQTYSSPVALVSALHTFITTLGNGDKWSVVWGTAPTAANTQSTQCVYQGPGSSGKEKIYIGMQVEFSEIKNRYYVVFYGMQGINTQAGTITNHFNMSQGVVISLGSQSFQFETRLFANARRFMLHVQFGAYSQFAYCGLMIPIARPTEYPYPLMVCANMDASNTINAPSSQTDYTSLSGQYNSDGWLAASDNFQLLQPDNIWQAGRAYQSSSFATAPLLSVYPWAVGAINNSSNKEFGNTTSSVEAFPYTASSRDSIAEYYEEFINSDVGPLLEQNYIRRRYSSLKDAVLGSMEGVRGVIGAKVAGSEITDNNSVKHYIVACNNLSHLNAALEMQ